jgi:hypothetical protein
MYQEIDCARRERTQFLWEEWSGFSLVVFQVGFDRWACLS